MEKVRLIANWLHPLGVDGLNEWYLASITCGRACSRLSAEDKKDRCQRVVVRRTQVSSDIFELAKIDDAVYISLIEQYVQDMTKELSPIEKDQHEQ